MKQFYKMIGEIFIFFWRTSINYSASVDIHGNDYKLDTWVDDEKLMRIFLGISYQLCRPRYRCTYNDQLCVLLRYFLENLRVRHKEKWVNVLGHQLRPSRLTAKVERTRPVFCNLCATAIHNDISLHKKYIMRMLIFYFNRKRFNYKLYVR